MANEGWFTDNLPHVGDIVQQVAGGGYTGYVREVNRQDGYVMVKWHKGTDNIFNEHIFFKYSPWNGKNRIKVITNPVPREWWPSKTDWMDINFAMWRSYHQLTELEMIEAVWEAGGSLAFAIEQGIDQFTRWTPPNRMPTHAEYADGAEDPDIYEDSYSDIERQCEIGDEVSIDINDHIFNGIVAKIERSDDNDQTQVTVYWEDITIWVNKKNLASDTMLIHPGEKVSYADNGEGIVLRSEHNAEHGVTIVLVYFESIEFVHDIDELNYL